MSPLDRDELAARVLVALAPLREGAPGELAREAFDLARAFDYEANRAVPSLADGEWRDAPKPAAPPSKFAGADWGDANTGKRPEWVPKVGDVVTIPSHRSDLSDELTGKVESVLGSTVNVRVNDHGSFVTYGRTNRRKADATCDYDDYVEPATAAERVAAGLDAAPASKPVDREGLAKAIRRAWWDRIRPDERADWLSAADAAIEFLGGAS